MYYNVVIKDDVEESLTQNELTFHFEDNYEEAIKFINYIITISNYHVEFLQFNIKDKKED